MKRYAADNLLLLRERYPEIYKAVRNREYDKRRIQPEEARNGQSNVVISMGDKQFRMYSRYDPGHEAARWVESLDAGIIGADNILILGLGLGYHAQALIQAYPDKRYYIYEPDPAILLAAIECTDLRDVLGHPQIVMMAIGMEPEVRTNLLTNLYRRMIGTFAHTITPPYRTLAGEALNDFDEIIRNTVRGYVSTMNTVSHYRSEWAENTVLNVSRNLISRSFYGLVDSCKGLPAVVVGSGPSLGMEIEKLKAFKDRSIIIAAGSSIQSLLAHGLTPHLIVSMDPGEANRRVFAKLDISDIPLLYISTIKHSAIRSVHSPYLMHAYFEVDSMSQYIMGWSNEDVVFASTATVTGTALQAAAYLGCREVILVGQDFSYANNQVYSDGVEHVSQAYVQRMIENADYTVENVTGGTNITNQSMLNLKSDTEEIISRLPKLRVYNASTIGAKIKHTTSKLLDQAIAQYPVRYDNEAWFKLLVQAQAKPYSQVRKDQVIARVQATVSDLHIYQAKLESLDTHMSAMLNPETMTTHKIRQWFGLFDETWNAVVASPTFHNLYAFFLTRERIYAERHWNEINQEQNLKDKVKLLRTYTKPLIDGLKAVTPILIESFHRLNDELQVEIDA